MGGGRGRERLTTFPDVVKGEEEEGEVEAINLSPVKSGFILLPPLQHVITSPPPRAFYSEPKSYETNELLVPLKALHRFNSQFVK